MNILKIKVIKKVLEDTEQETITPEVAEATDGTTEDDDVIYPLPNPQSIQWDMADIEAEGSSGRTQMGTYFRDVIAKKVTVSVSWGLLTDEQMSQILTAIDSDEFILIYPDAKDGAMREMTAYVSSRTAPMYRCMPSSQSETGDFAWVWQGLSINFMEK